jgi:hypothetical protein
VHDFETYYKYDNTDKEIKQGKNERFCFFDADVKLYEQNGI